VINSERALILAPAGRDATLAASLLAEAGKVAEPCKDLASLLVGLEQGAGLAIVAAEALQYADLRALGAWIETQPPWSDFPFILLSHRVAGPDHRPVMPQVQSLLGNVIFVERPFHPTALINTVAHALRGRRRQYQARDYLADREKLVLALAEERRRTEDALRGERALSGLLLTSVPAGIVAYDSELRITIWNPVMARIFGIDAEGVIGRRLPDVIGDGHRVQIELRLRDALAGSAAPMEEMEIDTPSGHQVVLESQHAPLRGGDGSIVGGAGFFRDISERRHVEDQLRQAQKMETIGQLTGGVAHDFNNLLAAIQGNLELLRKRLPDDPQVQRFIDGALQGAHRGASLTSRLLAFARRQDLKAIPTDLAALLEGTRGLIERSIGPQISVSFAIAQNLPAAKVDPNQLELAILNLAVNSRDAMPGGGQLTVSLDAVDGKDYGGELKGPFLRLCVADTGEGMDAETLRSAIEPFFSTKELGKGTGLGLSMVHGLAVQLGGALRLLSTPGQGTTAELWLPVTAEAISNTIEAIVEVAPARPAIVLVVDDDALINMNTVDMLEDLGHEVLGAYSGEEALKILGSGQQIDILVTDYAMPGMTGVELAGKARDVRPGLPILLATGYADLPSGTTTDLPRLAKPYRQADLANQVAQLLAGATS